MNSVGGPKGGDVCLSRWTILGRKACRSPRSPRLHHSIMGFGSRGSMKSIRRSKHHCTTTTLKVMSEEAKALTQNGRGHEETENDALRCPLEREPYLLLTNTPISVYCVGALCFYLRDNFDTCGTGRSILPRTGLLCPYLSTIVGYSTM